ncbi:tetratricopeptide repeat protein [Actinomadura rubteroloni]|uniref:tetratricopeptide repeat protein n=1 Tax=Actinomadura rubteroloni TaxID=1926885 RepID=UPI0011B08372|nr:tetratricopeptide repeat protein [Actinomadura rubteroloni]
MTRRVIGVGFLAGAAALLVATPGVLAAAGIKDWRLLTGAALVVPVAALLAGVWRTRFENAVQSREAHARELAKGTFAPAGKLPRVREITDPVRAVGVHPARRRDSGGDRVPAYVPRDFDGRLRAALAAPGFVLLVGDSTAGKTRAAFEAMRAVLPDHRLVMPVRRDGVAAAVAEAMTLRHCVLWLDDLEGFLGPGGLTRKEVAELLEGPGHHRIVLATLRAAEEDRLVSGDDDEGRRLSRESRAVLEQADRILVERLFSAPEKERAAGLADDDSRIADALSSADVLGVPEYLAAGPQLKEEWERAWARGTHPRAAALIAAAVDLRCAGFAAPLPRALLDETHGLYLEKRGGSRLSPESEEKAWEWATRLRDSGNAPLHAADDGTYELFDYLLDDVQRAAAPGTHAPEETITAALRHARADDAHEIAATAYGQGRYRLSETALLQAIEARTNEHGPEHPTVLAARTNLAIVLRDMGRLEEAHAEQRAGLEITARVLGPDHPDTLDARGNLVNLLYLQGRLDEAETEQRAVLTALERTLGPDHPSTLIARNSLGLVLTDLGRLDEAEIEHRAEFEASARLLGTEHPETLASRNNLARVLHELGRLEESEAEYRALLEAGERVLGREHPHMLIARNNRAAVLAEAGRPDEATSELRAVVEISERVLGPDHPDTVDRRQGLARMEGRG